MLVVNDVVNVMAAYQPVCKRAVDGSEPKHVGAFVGILIVLIFL